MQRRSGDIRPICRELRQPLRHILTISRFPDQDTTRAGCRLRPTRAGFSSPDADPPMRAMPLPMPAPDQPKRFVSTLTVRARIVAIALIPVAGFLATGIAFVSGENEVDGRLQQRRAGDRARRCQPGVQERGRHRQVRRARLRGAPAIELSAGPRDAQASATAQFITIRHLSEAAGQSNLDAIERTLGAAAAQFQRAAQGIRADRRREARPAFAPSCVKPPALSSASSTSTCRG